MLIKDLSLLDNPHLNKTIGKGTLAAQDIPRQIRIIDKSGERVERHGQDHVSIVNIPTLDRELSVKRTGNNGQQGLEAQLYIRDSIDPLGNKVNKLRQTAFNTTQHIRRAMMKSVHIALGTNIGFGYIGNRPPADIQRIDDILDMQMASGQSHLVNLPDSSVVTIEHFNSGSAIQIETPPLERGSNLNTYLNEIRHQRRTALLALSESLMPMQI